MPANVSIHLSSLLLGSLGGRSQYQLALLPYLLPPSFPDTNFPIVVYLLHYQWNIHNLPNLNPIPDTVVSPFSLPAYKMPTYFNVYKAITYIINFGFFVLYAFCLELLYF